MDNDARLRELCRQRSQYINQHLSDNQSLAKNLVSRVLDLPHVLLYFLTSLVAYWVIHFDAYARWFEILCAILGILFAIGMLILCYKDKEKSVAMLHSNTEIEALRKSISTLAMNDIESYMREVRDVVDRCEGIFAVEHGRSYEKLKKNFSDLEKCVGFYRYALKEDSLYAIPWIMKDLEQN